MCLASYIHTLYKGHGYLQGHVFPRVLYLGLWPGQKCHSKVMHRKEVTHSNDGYERKSRGRKLADEMGRGKKFPWYTHRLTHRKRVTCGLHDSYFHWMTINHAIPKIEWAIEWALNYYITQSRQKLRQLSASSSPSSVRSPAPSHSRTPHNPFEHLQ